jgi:oligopeptide/dipeptide ABC transporter ATP-binding protein
MTRAEADKRAEQLLAEVRLPPDVFSRRPRHLSGGQCQRVSIARALACSPDVLIADEPTSSLDVSVQAQILNLLRELREARGMALVLISHDLSVIHYLTDEALVMYRGRVVERGPTRKLLAAPRHPYTRILIDSIPGREGPLRLVKNTLNRPDGCVFASRCPCVEEECTHIEPRLVTEKDRAFACYFPLPDLSRQSEWSHSEDTGVIEVSEQRRS